MDNEIFRKTYNAINERFCPFEKSILTNNCRCSLAKHFCIAEREGVQCTADHAQERCIALLDLLRTRARFALKTTTEHAALPHAKAMRVQVGGLRGIQAALTPQDEVPNQIDDIDAVIRAAVEQFGSLNALPFQIIVQQITAYRGRRPLRSRR
ncbi:MAG: hypothetical protein N838_14635 [Thiohalocapsa sp. PB-PSB1]|jgi:hypothetical protein|nr:MAG: hypothetical protein N838_18930 [Thiohalocapsa sp. PB-PSB1]QQO54396.1 MAG: hypothetical protein N838_14635 [Thiohalocapsa sp. PB-PSB1]HCS89742.1 hypothetical protein [Chromatiaceae bacterium]